MGVVVGVTMRFLTSVSTIPPVPLGIGGTSFRRCWFVLVSPLLLREVRGLTFPLYCRYLICNMGLVVMAPTATVELCQNGGSNGCE
jgi:hypothetical protein